jgi:hypothetical protein
MARPPGAARTQTGAAALSGPAQAAEWPPFRGFAPIASCHWQGIANILARHGMPDALRRVAPSWGIRWPGGGTLYGGGGWQPMLRALFGATVHVHTAPTLDETEKIEQWASDSGRPFVAEVDAWYLPSPYQDTEHVVHTVVVMSRTPEGAVVADTMNNPRPTLIRRARYQQMRGHPCAGRLEPYKLYIPEPGPYRDLPASEIADAVRGEVARQAARSLSDLAAFIGWHARVGEPVDICRVAGERHQAAMLFDMLAGGAAGWALAGAARMAELRDDWYMVHMLTAHERAHETRQRLRAGRLLRQLLADEADFARTVGGP